MRRFRKALSEITLSAGDFLNARFRSNRSASPLVAGPKYPAARAEKSLAHAGYGGRRRQRVTLGNHSVASRLTSSEKVVMKINQLFCIQLIYGTWSRFRPRANFAICSICSAISLATFTIELFSSSHLSVSSCSSWAANYKTSNKTSTIRAPQEIIMISWRASKWMKEKRWCTSSRSSYNKFSQNFIVQNC